MASSNNEKPTKKITLRSSEGHLFDVELSVAMEFVAVKGFLEDNTESDEAITVPLPNISAAALTRTISYVKKHLEFTANSAPIEEGKAFDDQFAKEQSDDMLKELLCAANFLEVKYFLDFLAGVVARRIQNKSVEFVREYFAIQSDFTPEEEAESRRENAWAFEGVDED